MHLSQNHLLCLRNLNMSYLFLTTLKQRYVKYAKYLMPQCTWAKTTFIVYKINMPYLFLTTLKQAMLILMFRKKVNI